MSQPQGQAAPTAALHQRRQSLLRQLLRVNRRIAQTKEQLDRLAERMVTLSYSRRTAA